MCILLFLCCLFSTYLNEKACFLLKIWMWYYYVLPSCIMRACFKILYFHSYMLSSDAYELSIIVGSRSLWWCNWWWYSNCHSKCIWCKKCFICAWGEFKWLQCWCHMVSYIPFPCLKVKVLNQLQGLHAVADKRCVWLLSGPIWSFS